MTFSDGLTKAAALANAQAVYPNARLATPEEWDDLFAAANITYSGALTVSDAFAIGATFRISTDNDVGTLLSQLGSTVGDSTLFIWSDPDGSGNTSTSREFLVMGAAFADIRQDSRTPPQSFAGWLIVDNGTPDGMCGLSPGSEQVIVNFDFTSLDPSPPFNWISFGATFSSTDPVLGDDRILTFLYGDVDGTDLLQTRNDAESGFGWNDEGTVYGPLTTANPIFDPMLDGVFSIGFQMTAGTTRLQTITTFAQGEDFRETPPVTIAPCEESIEVVIDTDIMFCKNPNKYKCKTKKTLPVTIFGTNSFDVADIDPSTLQLCLEDLSACTNGPSDRSIADRGDPNSDLGAVMCAVDPSTGEELDFLNPDGFLDLDAAFEASEVQAMLGLFCDQPKNTVSEALIIMGSTFDGTPIYSNSFPNAGIDQLVRKKK